MIEQQAVGATDPGALLIAQLGRRRRRRLLHYLNWPLLAGGAIVLMIAAVCLAAPLYAQDPTALNITVPGAPPFTPGHLLGTDAPFGRDMLSRLVYGGRYDLLIGFGATGVTIVCGTVVGLVSGFFGGWLDTVLMRIVDVFFAFPFFVLVLAIVAMRGPGLFSLLIAIWFIGWVAYARIIRGEVLVAKRQEYVMAARALGYSGLRVMARHILPNVVSAALIFSMADAVANILLGASLGYFGLGVPEPTPEWGSMVAAGQDYLTTQWWVPTLPGIAIMILGTGLSLIGDGLADLLRPGD